MRTVSFCVRIKTGNEEGDYLTQDVILAALKQTFVSACGPIAVIGIKSYDKVTGGGNTKKQPQVRDEDVTEFLADKDAKLSQFKSDLEGDGFVV